MPTTFSLVEELDREVEKDNERGANVFDRFESIEFKDIKVSPNIE